MTGGRTYTNVNKHLAKARARVRLARLAELSRRERDAANGGQASARVALHE